MIENFLIFNDEIPSILPQSKFHHVLGTTLYTKLITDFKIFNVVKNFSFKFYFQVHTKKKQLKIEPDIYLSTSFIVVRPSKSYKINSFSHLIDNNFSVLHNFWCRRNKKKLKICVVAVDDYFECSMKKWEYENEIEIECSSTCSIWNAP